MTDRLTYGQLLAGGDYWAKCQQVAKEAAASDKTSFEAIKSLTAVPGNWLELDGHRYRLSANDVQRVLKGAPDADGGDEFVADMLGRKQIDRCGDEA